MSIQDMKRQTFPVLTIDKWKERSEKTLKGKSIEEYIYNSYENIPIQPLYTMEDVQEVNQLPGAGDGRRGYEALGYIKKPWEVAQQIIISENEPLNEALTKAINKGGQTALSFQITDKAAKDIPQLEQLAIDYPFALNGKEYYFDIIKSVSQFKNSQHITGFIGQDPVALYAEKGDDFSFEQEYEAFAHSVIEANEQLPKLRTILIDTVPYHQGGAHIVQELAIALSTAVYQMEQLSQKGVSKEEILEKMVVQFAVGSQFFMEAAKFRAARVLWSNFCNAYEVDGHLVISAVTSPFTKTIYDPHVNLLRAGNEAFAAVIGGVQYLHVSPYNEPENRLNEFAERIARNTQLILKEEAHLTRTVDPAGGSYYVEHLTNELAKKAWELFLEIEDRGGIVAVLEENWLQQEIANVLKQREEDVLTGKQTIVGTNKYFDEKIKPLQLSKEQNNETGIRQIRLTEIYEEQLLLQKGGQENDEA